MTLRHYVGWQAPPHPVEWVSTIVGNPGDSFDSQPQEMQDANVHAVLSDWWRDDDLSNLLSGQLSSGSIQDEIRQKYGISDINKELKNPNPWQLIDVYYNSTVGHAQDLRDAVKNAINKRLKFGPLSLYGPQDYGNDPVTIYYYDNDNLKRVKYPRAALSQVMQPGQQSWWKVNGVKTQQFNGTPSSIFSRTDGSAWGDEGFDWNKDVVPNVGTIVQTIIQIVGAILVATGVGAGVGVALEALSPVIGAAAQGISQAINSGNLTQVAKHFSDILAYAANAGDLSGKFGLTPTQAHNFSLDMVVVQNALAQSQQQTQLGKFIDTLDTISAHIHTVSDDTIKALAGALGDPGAANVVVAGYSASQTGASAQQLHDIGQLLAGQDATTLWELGAGLGLVAANQRQKGIGLGPMGEGVDPKLAAAHAQLAIVIRKLEVRYGIHK